MTLALPIEKAKKELDELVQQMHQGDTLTLINSQGEPVAVLISVKFSAPGAVLPHEREKQWKALAKEVGKAWKGLRGAVETLTGMRR